MHQKYYPPQPGDEEVPLFEIRSLSYRYPDGRPALEGIDLDIYRGDRIALVGHNGAGKTTFVKHLNGIYQPESGSVSYKGERLEGGYLERMRPEIGMLFQDPDDQLFCNTLYEDVAFGLMNQGLDREEVDGRVRHALKSVALDQFLYKAPHHLSYGQKKRAALSAVLAMRPEVLILDEPTANLDSRQERLFWELLQDFPGTLIIINHDLAFLYGICVRAVVMEERRIHHDFTMKELVSQRTYLRAHGLDFTFRFSCCQNHQEGETGSHGHSHPHLHPHSHPHSSSHSHAHTPHTDAHLHSHEESHPHPHAEKNDPLFHVEHDLPHPLPSQGPNDAGKVCEDPSWLSGQAHSPKGPALLLLENYSYRYPDGTSGLNNVCFSAQEGEGIAVVGENGAGKSTLARCLMGISMGRGRHEFDSKPVTSKNRDDLWRHMGMVFQDPSDQLFCPSCREEVAFGPKQMRLGREEIASRVEEALHAVRLTGYEDRVPHHLSAGERKRLAIAAVLSMRPRVLILDEPTASLDPQSEELLVEILQKLAVTKILISHDLPLIMALCRRTLVLHEGRVIRDYLAADFQHDKHLISINGLDYTYKNDCCHEIMALQQDFEAGRV